MSYDPTRGNTGFVKSSRWDKSLIIIFTIDLNASEEEGMIAPTFQGLSARYPIGRQ
jgi:hypothetical protein